MAHIIYFMCIIALIPKHIVMAPTQLYCLHSGRLYNPDWQICCQGSLYNKTEIFNPTSCCENLNDKGCCGNFTYDPWPAPTEIQCCNGRIQNALEFGCCGKNQISFLLSTEACCGNDVIIKDNTTCCGGKPLRTGHVCCYQDLDRGVEEHAIQKIFPDHTRCCASARGSITYSEMKSVCNPNGSVLPKPTQPRCGYEPYDPDRDLCCNYKVFKKEKEMGRRCCYTGASVYDPAKEECHGNVITKPSTQNPRKRKTKTIKCGNNCSVMGFKCFLGIVSHNDEASTSEPLNTILMKLGRDVKLMIPLFYLRRIRGKNRWRLVKKIVRGRVIRMKNKAIRRIQSRKPIPSKIKKLFFLKSGPKKYLTSVDNLQGQLKSIERKQVYPG